ncbi:right-handed parallel beta-helix repeat-containing protein [Caulobacter sp. LARHSG274]
MRTRAIALGLVSGLAFAAAARAATVRVDCAGLPQADAAIAAAIGQAGPGGTVELSGLCRLAGPVAIPPGVSGRPGAPFVLRGAAGAALTGLTPLRAAPVDPAALSLAPAAARPHLAGYVLPPALAQRYAGFGGRGNAYDAKGAPVLLAQDDQTLRQARWPNDGYASAPIAQPQKGPVVAPAFASDRADAWAREPDLWAGGFWTFDWAYETAKVARVEAGAVTLAPLRTRYDEAKTLSYFVYNAVSELDQPGEFVVLPGGRVLAWPARPGAPLEVAQATRLLSIAGAHDIRVEALALVGALDGGARVVDSADVSLSGLRVTRIGGVGIQVEGGRNVVIDHADIDDIGETGVFLRGGERRSLTPGGHAVVDSRIRRFGQLTRAYRPGVQLQGVGLSVRGSHISDAPHSAIIYAGNDHLIDGNEIDHVVRETGDAGAIYAGRDLVARGTTIQNNYIHDVTPGAGPGKEVRGVYFDDYLGGQVIRDNLFLRVMDPVFIHGGSQNQVSGNLIACSTGTAIYIESIRPERWARFAPDLERARLQAQTPDAMLKSRYPGFTGVDPQSAASSQGNLVADNEIPDGARNRFDNAPLQKIGPMKPGPAADCSGAGDAAILSRWRRSTPGASG